ncbi:hypothetical protein CONLIGDRAFT_40681 [Coniochaeta ligniaria NRRL 30616]|uniref:Secreted protein n=1 Tax=Coniochaeta ligniaria NRRL 30616 TaxID=1408157 RepID=A0A1J7J5K4_9PEZI|nr:hypothetical protein CONLIGDRAFT_40681 [Coniochaeta ligniaria NRRL 30616]
MPPPALSGLSGHCSWALLGPFRTIIIAALAASSCESASTQQEDSGKMENVDGWLGRRQQRLQACMRRGCGPGGVSKGRRRMRPSLNKNTRSRTEG